MNGAVSRVLQSVEASLCACTTWPLYSEQLQTCSAQIYRKLEFPKDTNKWHHNHQQQHLFGARAVCVFLLVC